MYLAACDSCKKVIKKQKEFVTVGYGLSFASAKSLCDKCGEPVIKFLAKAGLLDRKEKQSKNRRFPTKKSS